MISITRSRLRKVDQFEPPRDLVEPVLAAALEDVDLAGDPVGEDFLDPHHHRRAPGVEHVEVEPEARLEIGQLVEAFLEQFGIDIAAARDEHDADRLVALVAHVLEDRQLLVGDRLRDLLDQLALRDLVGDLVDHQLPLPAAETLDARVAVLGFLGLGSEETAAHAEAAAPGLVGRSDGLGALGEDPAGGEIGALEQLHQPRMLDMRIVDHLERRIDDLGDIVARDIGRHAHRDAARAIGEQIGEQAGKDLRLLLLAIVGRDEIDRPLVEPLHQPQRGLGQAGFGVAVGGGVIAVDIAEIALPLDQRVAQREILREANHRVIDRSIAMRMVLADHVADHACALLES